MKKFLFVLLSFMLSYTALHAVSINISNATITITGATTFTMDHIGMGPKFYWADFAWSSSSNKFYPTDYGPEADGIENSGFRALPGHPGFGKDVPIDISDAIPSILSSTEFRLDNVSALGGVYWGEFRWNSTTNKFDVYDYGETEWTCDYFNRPNSSTVDGWTEQSGDWSIYNNMLASQVTTSWQYITYNGSSQQDGCIEGRAIYRTGGGVQFIGLDARFANTSSYGVMAKIQDNTSGGNFNRCFIYCNGSMLTYLDITATTDANIQLEYTGTAVHFRIDRDRNGTWDYDMSATVSATAAGLSGASAYNGTYLDDWCYGIQCMNDSQAPQTEAVDARGLDPKMIDAALQ